LIRFVNELLDVSRTEQGLILGEREWGDLVGLALDVAERRRSRLHEIIVDNEGPVVGFYDWGRMDQVLENLVENAIKYSPEGGDIRISVWKQNDEARIDVRDQGIGIPAKDLPHTFDRFYRGANVNDRQFAGLGLGLFMCRRIIEAHGGRIDVESVLGRGTTVHVSLPWEDKVGSGE
jgi:signal transduction histidine kinase